MKVLCISRGIKELHSVTRHSVLKRCHIVSKGEVSFRMTGLFYSTRRVIRVLIWCALSLTLSLSYGNVTTAGLEAPNWRKMPYEVEKLRRAIPTETPYMPGHVLEDLISSIQAKGKPLNFRCALKSRLFLRAMIKKSFHLMHCCLGAFYHAFNSLAVEKHEIIDDWESDVTKAVRELMKQGDAVFAHLQGEHIAAWMQRPEWQRNEGLPSLGAIDTAITSDFGKYVTLHWRNKLSQAPKPDKESLPFVFALPKCRRSASQLIPPSFALFPSMTENGKQELTAPQMVQQLVSLAYSSDIVSDSNNRFLNLNAMNQITNPVCQTIDFVWARVLGAYAALAPAFDDFIKTQPSKILEEMHKLRKKVQIREDEIQDVYKKAENDPSLETLTQEEKEKLWRRQRKLHKDKLRIVEETRTAKEMVAHQLQSRFRVEALPYGMNGRYVCSAVNWILQRFLSQNTLGRVVDQLYDEQYIGI